MANQGYYQFGSEYKFKVPQLAVSSNPPSQPPASVFPTTASVQPSQPPASVPPAPVVDNAPLTSTTFSTKFQSFITTLDQDISTTSDAKTKQTLQSYRAAIIEEEEARMKHEGVLIQSAPNQSSIKGSDHYDPNNSHIMPGLVNADLKRIADLISKPNRPEFVNLYLTSIYALQPFINLPAKYREHMLVAGGYVFNLMNRWDMNPLSDIDIFIHGVDDVAGLIIEVINLLINGSRFNDIIITPHAITLFLTTRIPIISFEGDFKSRVSNFQDHDVQYQFILRKYDTMSQILLGFDLDASRVGLTYTGAPFDLNMDNMHQDYDKFNWYVTPTSKQVLATQMLIPGPIFSTTFEHRIAKMRYRGLSIYIAGTPELKTSESQHGFSRLEQELKDIYRNRILLDYIADYDIPEGYYTGDDQYIPEGYDFKILYGKTRRGNIIFIKIPMFTEKYKLSNQVAYDRNQYFKIDEHIETLDPSGQGSFHPLHEIKSWQQWLQS